MKIKIEKQSVFKFPSIQGWAGGKKIILNEGEIFPIKLSNSVEDPRLIIIKNGYGIYLHELLLVGAISRDVFDSFRLIKAKADTYSLTRDDERIEEGQKDLYCIVNKSSSELRLVTKISGQSRFVNNHFDLKYLGEKILRRLRVGYTQKARSIFADIPVQLIS